MARLRLALAHDEGSACPSMLRGVRDEDIEDFIVSTYTLLRTPGYECWLVAGDEGQPEGLLTASLTKRVGLGSDDDTASVHAFYVSPKARRGAAHALWDRFRVWARAMGVRHIQADIVEGNERSMRLAKAKGMRRIASTWEVSYG